MARIIWPLRSRDTWCVPLDRYGLYGVEPGLIVVQGHPGSFAQAEDKEGVPQIHLGVPVMEDGILYNLPNIKRYILYDGIVEQGTLGCHFTHVRHRNKTRRDEVMPHLRYEGQMLGLKVDCMARTIDFPLTPAIGQDPDDLWVVGVLVKPIERLRWDMIETIKAIDRLRTEVDQYASHPYFLKHVGCEIGVELSHHTHRSWMRWLAQGSPSLSRYGLPKEVIRMVETFLLYEGSVLANGAKPIGGTRIHEPREPTPLGRQFLPFTRH